VAARLRPSVAVVHTHDPLATCAALGARPPGVAVVQTVHGPWSRENATMHRRARPRYQARMEAIERAAFAGADRFIAVDQGQADLAVRDFGVDPRRIAVIPNAVDVESLPAPPSASAAGEPFLLVPRRLVPKNGVEFAIRAVARLGPGSPRLVVAGDGPLRADLEALARELSVAGRVTFLGDVDRAELLPMVSAATAVLVPSVPVNAIVEATSLAVLEAMASRVPVVGSRIGGIAEIMADGSGVLVPPGDPDALAGAIRTVLALGPGERAALGERARARVGTAYGVDVWLRRIRGVYREAVGERPSRVA
jgi:glycosyltransferase involved in cell wall biosynthesis